MATQREIPQTRRIRNAMKRIGYRYGLCLPPVEGIALDLARLKRLIGKPNPTILEIGAHHGTDTLRMTELFPDATVHCFEPEQRAIRQFRQAIPPDHPQITLHECAVSDLDGEMQFYPSQGRQSEKRPEGWDDSGSLRPPKRHLEICKDISFGAPVTVQTRRLDSWLREHSIDHVDFIWMDVQGAEDQVLRGAGDMIPSIDLIFTEYSQKELYAGQFNLRQLVKLLPGFTIETRLANDVLFRNTRAECRRAA